MKKILIPALLCLTLAAGCTCENTIRRRADVLVIGGTTSGTTAAIAAARQGVQTLVVEETPMLGGMLTAQGVCATDGNFNLPSGLWNEFRDHLRKRYGGIGALWTGWVSTTLFEPHVADSIFHAMAAAEPTLEVVHGYRLTGILRRGKRVTGAEFTDARGGRMLVRARITVDATDLGDALPLSGTSYRLGMDARADTGEELALAEANDAVQDLTVVAILKDYGPGADRTIERPAGYDPAEFAGCYDLSSEGVRSADRMLEYGRMPGGKYMINWPKEGNDINLDVVELPHAERTAALEAARQKTLRFVYHIQHELGYRRLGIADDEFDTPDGLAYLPYHREGRRMDGVVRMTLDDVTDRYARPLYRTGISVGDYPVDHHRNCRTDLPKILFPPVPSFSVPLGALIPRPDRELHRLGQSHFRLEPRQRLDAPATGRDAYRTGRGNPRGAGRRTPLPAAGGSRARGAGSPAGPESLHRAALRRKARRSRLRDPAAHRRDGHPAHDGRAVPLGEPFVVLPRADDPGRGIHPRTARLRPSNPRPDRHDRPHRRTRREAHRRGGRQSPADPPRGCG